MRSVHQRVSDQGGAVAHVPEPAPGASLPLDDIVATLGGLDIAIRWSPRGRTAPVTADGASFAQDLDRMLLGAHRMAVATAQVMRGSRSGRGHGSLVLVGSIDATHAYPGRSSAATAMAGILGLVRALGVELAPHAIRANAVLVGPLGDAAGDPPPGLEHTAAAQMLLRSPQRRFVTPDQVADAICFVAGPRSGFMTGQSLSVDGGWSALNQAPRGMRFP